MTTLSRRAFAAGLAAMNLALDKSDKPVNVLVSAPFTTVAQLAALGVRRISVGGALARTAWAGVLRAAREIAERGTFDELTNGTSAAELNRFFS